MTSEDAPPSETPPDQPQGEEPQEKEPQPEERTPDKPDSIRLSLPARHEYARIARIAMAALALRLGFSYREIEDLRLAVDEALIFLLGSDRPGERVTIMFTTEPGRVTLTATTSFPTAADDPSRQRFETLIGDLVDKWETDEAGGSLTFTKHHRASE